MKFFATRRQAWLYGRRMCKPTGISFTVQQVETGRWQGYWFAMPECAYAL